MSAHLREAWRKLAAPPRFYHGTDVALQPGDAIVSGGSRRNYDEGMFAHTGVVFMSSQAAVCYFYAVLGGLIEGSFREPHVYEVEAPDATPSQIDEWTAPQATVVADVTTEARAALKAEWPAWQSMIEKTEGGIPSWAILVEFKNRLGHRLASIETEVGEDKGIPVLHLDVSPGSEAYQWGQQAARQGLWDGDTHSMVLIETQHEGLPRSSQRYLPACVCGRSGGWMSFANRHKAAQRFWMYHTKTEPWRKQAIRATRGGVLEMVPTQTVIRTYKFMDAMSGTWADIRAENLADAKSGSEQHSTWAIESGESSLYESIRDEGFWEAILVFEYDNGERWVVDGHTRLSVAEDLGLPQVPIEVRHEKSTQPVKVVVEGRAWRTAASAGYTVRTQSQSRYGGELRWGYVISGGPKNVFYVSPYRWKTEEAARAAGEKDAAASFEWENQES